MFFWDFVIFYGLGFLRGVVLRSVGFIFDFRFSRVSLTFGRRGVF